MRLQEKEQSSLKQARNKFRRAAKICGTFMIRVRMYICVSIFSMYVYNARTVWFKRLAKSKLACTPIFYIFYSMVLEKFYSYLPGVLPTYIHISQTEKLGLKLLLCFQNFF